MAVVTSLLAQRLSILSDPYSMPCKFCIPLVDEWYTKPYREATSSFDDLVERTNL